MFYFSESSMNKLNSVNWRLKQLALAVLRTSPVDFAIIDGKRSLEKQQLLYKQGKSKCDGIDKRSKHQDGLAIDFAVYINGELDFNSNEDYCLIAGLFLAKAKELNIRIRSGAIWNGSSIRDNTFKDLGHIEIL